VIGLSTGSPGQAQPTHLKGQRFALPVRIGLAAEQLVELQGHVGTVKRLNDPGPRCLSPTRPDPPITPDGTLREPRPDLLVALNIGGIADL